MRIVLILTLGVLLVGGCRDDDVTSPRDFEPAAPRGFTSITGDHEVFLSWLPNTESDVVGYRVYLGDCPSGGPNCPYDPIGETRLTTFRVDALANGQTRYFAVSAFDRAGHESELSLEDVFDTPRPEGFGLVLANAAVDSTRAGFDFSEFSVVSYSSTRADIFYATSGGQRVMMAPFVDTEIQDAGYATSLDAVDFAPQVGWSPTGSVELIVGHCYVVWTHDDHFAKFRVTGLTANNVVVDWAYQVDPGNRELKQRRTAPEVRRRRPGIGALSGSGA